MGQAFLSPPLIFTLRSHSTFPATKQVNQNCLKLNVDEHRNSVNSNVNTLIVVQENVFDPKMVGLKALVAGFLGGKTLLQLRKEDPRLGTGIRILQALQHRTEGTVCGVAGLLAMLQELLHRPVDDVVSSHCRQRSPQTEFRTLQSLVREKKLEGR